MKGFGAPSYGDMIADVYDDLFSDVGEDMIDALVRISDGRPALELGIGTGRVALPLAERGVEVHGVDASEAMLARLRAKPGGKAIPTAVGDFSEIPGDRRYGLVYVVFNTFFALMTQDAQLACFASVADHLEPGGAFLLEVFFPDVARFDRGQTVRASSVEIDSVLIEATQHDPLRQVIVNQHIILERDGVRLYPVALRYAWPSELDLMALAAGLRLRQRWGDWREGPFTASSGRHISIYTNDQENA